MARIRTSDIGDQRSLRAMQDLLKPEHVHIDEVTRDPRSQSLVVFARFDHQSKSEARRVAIAEAAAYDADLDAFSSEAIVARVLDALYNDV